MSDSHPTETARELRGVLMRWAILLAMLGVFAIWATWRMATAANRLSTQGIIFAGAPEGSLERDPSPAPQEGQALYRCTMPECGDQGSADPNSRCPVCGMKRERVNMGLADAGEFEIALGERAQRLAEVETAPAERRLLFKRIRAVGRVGYDETRYRMVSAWIGGRIDKLFADFTGMTVSKGDHLVEMYSPELLSAQEEYLQAFRSVEASRDAQTGVPRRGSEQVRSSARRKLELLGVTDDQIAAAERSGSPQSHLAVFAPIGGTILDKHAMEGMYVKTGDTLYTIADLTHLWLLVDLYESDLPWARPFQDVRVTTRSLPGEVFTGEIVFVDPRVDARTRTVSVRIHLENPAMRLKPDMWVSAEIKAGLSLGGRGAVPAPDGDFACPMHPWETADDAGTCSICEMKLVPVTDLPQFAAPTDPAKLLSAPRDAVLQTGARSLVYVESAPGVYQGKEVVIGPLAHDESGDEYFPILRGLSVGERVVTRGNFAIDSQMQLEGKPSLFSSQGSNVHHHGMHDGGGGDDD